MSFQQPPPQRTRRPTACMPPSALIGHLVVDCGTVAFAPRQRSATNAAAAAAAAGGGGGGGGGGGWAGGRAAAAQSVPGWYPE
jgi:hypothetical protein